MWKRSGRIKWNGALRIVVGNALLIFKSLNLLPLLLLINYHLALKIFFPLLYDVPTIDISHNYYNYRVANYLRIIKYLKSFNWIETIRLLDVDCSLNDVLYIKYFVPMSMYVKSKFPGWCLLKHKSIVFANRQAHALFKQSNNPCHYAKLSIPVPNISLIPNSVVKSILSIQRLDWKITTAPFGISFEI